MHGRAQEGFVQQHLFKQNILSIYITVIVNSVKLQCAQDHLNVRSFQSLSLLIYFRFVFR